MYVAARNWLPVFSAFLCSAGLARAQATRTWVSGVGDDANPCSRTAPCKTFAGAISKTAAGGEISALDPGGFGAVTITKSITINGDGTLAGILASNTNGVIINAGVNDVVTLRGISIHGAGNGLNGVRYLAAGMVVIENCTIQGFTQNGIDVTLAGAGRLSVRRTSITGGLTGVKVTSTTGRVTAVLSDVAIRAAGIGVYGLYGSIDVSHSVISQNSGYGVLAEGGVVTVSDTLLAANGVAAQAQSGATLRLSNSDVYDNLTGFGCGGGTLASAGNNRKAGNTGGVAPVCTPTVMITVQ